MGFIVTVKDQNLKDLITKLEDLSLSKVTADSASNIEYHIVQEFASAADPFGSPWEGGMHLIDTGSLVDSIQVTGTQEGFQVQLDDVYGFHQSGTSKMPARPILPLDGEIPDSWDEELTNSLEKLVGDKS